jgi:hypothetical protein
VLIRHFRLPGVLGRLMLLPAALVSAMPALAAGNVTEQEAHDIGVEE